MNNLPDNLIIEMFKNLDIKSAIRLGRTSKRHLRLLNGLWEFYLNRDFPQAAQPLDRDFKTTYIQLHLRAAVNKLEAVVDYILDPRNGFSNLNGLRLLQAIISAINDETTAPQLTSLLLALKVAVSANYITTASEQTPLIKAAARGNTAIAQALIQAGANVNVVDYFGNTPLIYAADNDNTALAQALIQAGVNVNTACKDDGTPLFLAARRGHAAFAQCLIQAGANVNTTFHSMTPLIVAAMEGQTAVAQLLIQAGAIVDAATYHGTTPLFYAKKVKNPELIKLLEGVIHFRSTVKPMLISKAMEIQKRKNSLEQNGNSDPNTMLNVM